MFCIKCGFELSDKAIFCSKCGSKIVMELKHEKIEDEKESLEIVLPTEAEFSNKDKYKVLKIGRIFLFFFIPFITVAMVNAEKRPNTFLIDSLITGLIWMGILTPFFGFKRKLKPSIEFCEEFKRQFNLLSSKVISNEEYEEKRKRLLDFLFSSKLKERRDDILLNLSTLKNLDLLNEKEFSAIKRMLDGGNLIELKCGKQFIILEYHTSLRDAVGCKIFPLTWLVNGEYETLAGDFKVEILDRKIVGIEEL